jgi:probable DNA metabolism protein
MYTITIPQTDDLEAFRTAARKLLCAGIHPADVIFSSDTVGSLFCQPLPVTERVISVSRDFGDVASAVACHRDELRWSLLYQTLWRIDQGERELMHQLADPLVHRLGRMASAIKRDQHRMTAFVRFRLASGANDELYIAWYEPQHRILRRTASFFIDRFANMRFSILTPDLTLHWDRTALSYAPGVSRKDAVSPDAVEAWWCQYYTAIFNPARVNPGLMRSHMPKHFWRNLPEARTILELIAEAGPRTDQMIQSPSQASGYRTMAD